MSNSAGHGEDEKKRRYLERAAELRDLATHVRDQARRDALIRAAEAYERLAEWKPAKPPDDGPG